MNAALRTAQATARRCSQRHPALLPHASDGRPHRRRHFPGRLLPHPPVLERRMMERTSPASGVRKASRMAHGTRCCCRGSGRGSSGSAAALHSTGIRPLDCLCRGSGGLPRTGRVHGLKPPPRRNQAILVPAATEQQQPRDAAHSSSAAILEHPRPSCTRRARGVQSGGWVAGQHAMAHGAVAAVRHKPPSGYIVVNIAPAAMPSCLQAGRSDSCQSHSAHKTSGLKGRSWLPSTIAHKTSDQTRPSWLHGLRWSRLTPQPDAALLGGALAVER